MLKNHNGCAKAIIQKQVNINNNISNRIINNISRFLPNTHKDIAVLGQLWAEVITYCLYSFKKKGPCRVMKKITTRSAPLTPCLNITQTLGCLGYNHTDMLILVVFIFLETDLKLLDGLQSCNFSVL